MESKYTAIIIEPRRHNALSFVLNNFLNNLNNNWNIIVFHGKNNKEFLLNIIKTVINPIHKRRIQLIKINVDNLTSMDYNNLLKSPVLYNFIPTETFMIFQTDTMILPKYKHYLDFFLEFDYVGAPWEDGVVGNGGLSIRKKSKMLEIINMYQKDNNKDLRNNEDVIFSLNPYVSLFKPTFEQAKLFSMEKVFSEKGSFGIHNAWNYIDNQLLQTHCDEISILKSLQEPHFNIL